MEILYVSYDGMTDALGRSQVIPYLEGLAKLGHTIHVLSCEKKHIPEAEKAEVQENFNTHGIGWTRLVFSTTPPGISKIADIYRIVSTARKLHQKHGFQIVHCRSYIAALAGLELKKRYGVRFVFDMRGFWANERIEGDIWNLNNPVYKLIYRYFKRKEAQFFFHADAVISLTHNGKRVIEDLFGTDVSDKTTVIPCCADTSLFSSGNIKPEALQQKKLELGLNGCPFVLSYLGSIGTWYMTHEMMLFYKKLKTQKPGARFLFISGDDPAFIKEKAMEAGLEESDIVVAKAGRKQVPLYLALSSLSVFFIRPVFSKKASSPTKQAEIMSMGIPMVCNAGIGDTDEIMQEERAGILLEDFSDEEFDKALERIDDVLAWSPADIRAAAIKRFSLEDGVESYHYIYMKLSDKGIA